MKTLARWTRAAGVGAVLVAVGALGACGDSGDSDDAAKDSAAEDDGGPADASKEDFCKVAVDAPGEDVDAIHDWAGRLEEVGTPEDIPDDARDGFELLVELAADIDEEDLENDSLEDEFSADEKAHFEAYGAYIGETCAPSAPDLESGTPEPDTETPTE